MGTRLQLQTLLEAVLGSRNVYFQPPETVKLIYPCIIYSRSSANSTFANDGLYGNHTGYKIIVVDKNPDSLIPGKVALIPMCKFETHYTRDNLNHDVYNIYY